MKDPDFKARHGLSDVINAAGTFTPVGVSRSSSQVAAITADALGDYFIIEELQQAAGRVLARWSGAEAGALTHCTAAAITLSVAAAMTGDDGEAVAGLPRTEGLANKVVLPAGHAVNYGQPITQAIRLAGAEPVLAGTKQQCSLDNITKALAMPGIAALMLVSSRLTFGQPVDLAAATDAAHRAGIKVIIDGAAQDMRIDELLALGADLVLVSAQKYLAAPTAGIVVGNKALVSAVRAQEKGIGRGMKAGKEAICGVLAAIEARQAVDLAVWASEQADKVQWLEKQLRGLPGLTTSLVNDTAGLPLARLCLQVDADQAGMDAATLSQRLKDGTPSLWLIDREAMRGELSLEVVQLGDDELKLASEIISGILGF